MSTLKHMDSMFLNVGVEGLCPNPRLICSAIMCADTCVIKAGAYLYVGMGVKDENADILMRLMALSDGGRRCVIATGDFNITLTRVDDAE